MFRELAETAILEAQAAGAAAKALDKARELMTDGDQLASVGPPDAAVGHYSRAWRRAKAALAREQN